MLSGLSRRSWEGIRPKVALARAGRRSAEVKRPRPHKPPEASYPNILIDLYLFLSFFVGLHCSSIYLVFIFSFGKSIFKICFRHFSIKSDPFFPRKKNAKHFFAEISPFRSRFQIFQKWNLELSLSYYIYPIRSQRILKTVC